MAKIDSFFIPPLMGSQLGNDIGSSIQGDDIELSDADIENLRSLHMSDASKMMEYLDPILQEQGESLTRQVDAVEKIAVSAEQQSQSLAEQVLIMEQQVEMAKQDAADAKKDSRFAKITAVIAIIVSIAAIIAPLVYTSVSLRL